MPLVYMLYRCPVCGHDPTEAAEDDVRCTECGRRFARGVTPFGIRVTGPSEANHEVPAYELTRAIEEHGGPLTRATLPDGSLRYKTPVVAFQKAAEVPIRFRGELFGYSEKLDDGRSGILNVTSEELCLSTDAGPERWALLDIHAVQTSSASVQIVLEGIELIQFRFITDSPRRWEILLRHAIREAWARAGRGEIVEFQPRITTR